MYTHDDIEEERDHQWGRFVFKLYDRDRKELSRDDEHVADALHRVAGVPRNLLPAKSLGTLIREGGPLAEAAGVCRVALRNNGAPVGIYIRTEDVRPAELLVSLLRYRMLRNDSVQYMPWTKFIAWVSSWVSAPPEEAYEAREEMWRLENVYGALAIEGLGDFTAPTFMRDYLLRILIQRRDNGLRTFISTSQVDMGMKALVEPMVWKNVLQEMKHVKVRNAAG